MRKLISVLLVALMIVCLCACGANNSASQSTDNTNTTPDENTSKEQTAPSPSSETTSETKQATNAIETAETIPSFIVARGTPEGCVYDADFATISVESWDLGTSQNPLSQEDALCIKYHVKNKTEETIALEGIFNVFVYIDGVQRESFISNFYGDMSSFQVFPDTKLRPDAETDVYMCYACDLTLPHHVDIDIGNRLERVPDSDFFYANEDIIGSLAFEIDK